MAWHFNNPQSATLSSTPVASPQCSFTDGKNMYVSCADGNVYIYSIWGPQQQDYTIPAPEITLSEFDDNHSTRNVPTLIKTISFGSSGGKISPSARSIVWFDGTTFKKTAMDWRATPNILTLNTQTPQSLSGTNSEFIVSPATGKIFVVSAFETTQSADDAQHLWVYDTTVSTLSGFTDLGALPDAKQIAPRSLVINGDYLYVSSNSLGAVHKYVAATGAFVSSIFINRDVRKLYVADGLVYILSSDKGPISGQKATMVSSLDDSGTVTHLTGILGGEPLSGGTEFAKYGNFAYFSNSNGAIQRTDLTTGLTMFDTGANDYQISTDFLTTDGNLSMSPPTFLGTGNGTIFGVSSTSSVPENYTVTMTGPDTFTVKGSIKGDLGGGTIGGSVLGDSISISNASVTETIPSLPLNGSMSDGAGAVSADATGVPISGAVSGNITGSISGGTVTGNVTSTVTGTAVAATPDYTVSGTASGTISDGSVTGSVTGPITNGHITGTISSGAITGTASGISGTVSGNTTVAPVTMTGAAISGSNSSGSTTFNNTVKFNLAAGKIPFSAGDTFNFSWEKTGLQHISLLPPVSWDYNDGTTQSTYSNPGYLIMMTATKIYSAELSYMFYWDNNITMNQYVAVSTGINRYKGA